MAMSDPATGDQAPKVSFGYSEVPEGERQRLVNDVFSTVAERYDLMNDLMSGGLHRLWKDDFVAMLNPPRPRIGVLAGAGEEERPWRLLDVAGGTGDIVLRALERGGYGCSAVLCDISAEMLSVGRRRVEKAGRSGQVDIVEANAEALPFEDRGFDAYTIAFGIRNVTHIDKALAEAYRVLKVGGHFLCLEFSECQVPVLDRLYDLHSFQVIPQLGKLAAGAAEPYQYLVESIRKFPSQERFATMVREAGFSQVTYRNLTGGIAAIHSGWRI